MIVLGSGGGKIEENADGLVFSGRKPPPGDIETK
jgi:hypothetical protein